MSAKERELVIIAPVFALNFTGQTCRARVWKGVLLSPALAPQTSLHDGAFIIESVIGRGGFGITYRARDVRNQREVALKECFPLGCERRENAVVAREFWAHSHLAALQNRFRAQAQRLQTLSHPNLARVWDGFDENDTVYLVMELVEGPTLLRVIEEREIAVEEALEWIEKLAFALGALHDAGLLHLDVKPENVILRENEPILLDFDLVQLQDGADVSTRPLALALQCGTPGYAPLEQYASTAKLSPASDFHALGATFYHLLTAKPPLGALDRAAGTSLVSPLQIRPLLAPFLAEAIARALEIKSEARPASAREFVASMQEPTPAPEDDDAADIALAPQLMKHGTGFHRVVLTAKTPVLPARCVCCHDKSDTTWLLNSPSGRWELPLCQRCYRHQNAAKAAGAVTFWGSILSLGIAVLVVGLSFVASSLWPLLLGPVCIVMNFAALSYGALKSSRAEEMLKPNCCDLTEPATYVFNGKVHIWRFKNGHFAADFKKRNADFVA